MMGLITLVAQIIILMTRMLAQVRKNTRGSIENTLWGAAVRQRGTAGGRTLFSQPPVVFLHIGAIILVIRMIICTIRMISPTILNHPRLGQKHA